MSTVNHLAARRLRIYIPEHNAKGKRDVTGAFKPEAIRLKKLSAKGSEIVVIDNHLGMRKRRDAVMRDLESLQPSSIDSVAFLCHGWSNGVQVGFTRGTLEPLARVIRDLVPSYISSEPCEPVVALFCCSTGDDNADTDEEASGTGDESFADRLRDSMCKAGAWDCRVMGHTTVAHATKNPDVLFFDGMGSTVGGVGGFAPVGRKSPMWKPWRNALQKTDLRLRFPWMSVGQIHAELLPKPKTATRRPRR